MRILSDFDGVWTDPVPEAQSVRDLVVEQLAECTGRSHRETNTDFAQFAKQVLAEPSGYGWMLDGRLTAFVDEDPFCLPNGVVQYVEQATQDERTAPYRAAVAERYDSFRAFADFCFFEGMRRYRDNHPPALVGGARKVVDRLSSLGAEIVVVSNSPAEKIEAWFDHAGVHASETSGEGLRVRGTAGKQVLGAAGTEERFGQRSVCVDRPQYRAILEEERPDLVIGDVFSLDLALPSSLRKGHPPGAGPKLVLRRHDHTPEWAFLCQEEGWFDESIDRLDDLVSLVEQSDLLL